MPKLNRGDTVITDNDSTVITDNDSTVVFDRMTEGTHPYICKISSKSEIWLAEDEITAIRKRRKGS